MSFSFFKKIKDFLSIAELRNRLSITFFYLLIFRIGTFITLPNVNTSEFNAPTKGILDFLNTFLAGAFKNASVLGLGIFPYISASIAIQLLIVIVPSFQRMQMEGHSGRKKLNKITKFATIFFSVIQSTGYLSYIISVSQINVNLKYFFVVSIFILTAGTMFCMWLADKITDRGLGNGSSLLISVGIISTLPGAMISEYTTKGGMGSLVIVLIELLSLFAIVVLVVAFTQSVRKVPIQYSQQMISSNLSLNNRRQYIPFKLNSVGVMPIIFAQTILFIPALGLSQLAKKSDSLLPLSLFFNDPNSFAYSLIFAILVAVFSFFYVAITVNTDNMASEMKRNGSFIPGVMSGNPTSEYLEKIMSRLTALGAIFLAMFSMLPYFAKLLGVGVYLSRFFGGTSLLIIVGSILEVLQQIEAFSLSHRYSDLTKNNYSKIINIGK